MWTCARCSEEHDEVMDSCWSCGASREGKADPAFRRVDAPEDEPGLRAEPVMVKGTSSAQKTCPFCRQDLVPEPGVPCSACAVRVHDACARELIRCPSIACRGTFEFSLEDDSRRASRPCLRCGSDRVVPRAMVSGQQSIRVSIAGDPSALLFRNLMVRALFAQVCGDCGHAEMWIDDPEDFYQHHLKSTER